MKPRVDEALVARGLAGSIAEAKLMVMEGRVYLGGGKVGNPSDKVREGLALTVRGGASGYVSRGAHKLEKALTAFGIDATGRVSIDIGASTGGFTDVLLRRGAARVYAVDVGFGLLDWKLRSDPRVAVLEKTNARHLTPDQFDPRPTLGVTDVSFISLSAILPPALAVLDGPERRFVALVKPQFEARREQVGAGGVVRDRAVHMEVLRAVTARVRMLNWRAQAVDFSPITGAEGNIEFLLDLAPEGDAVGAVGDGEIARAVDAAWSALAR